MAGKAFIVGIGEATKLCFTKGAIELVPSCKRLEITAVATAEALPSNDR